VAHAAARWLVVAGLVAAAPCSCSRSRAARPREFLSEARFELRKVVWPTRQETMRTTWVVIVVVVIIISLMLALFDSSFTGMVRALLGPWE
jgi:preprotein translocase subunit SecE